MLPEEQGKFSGSRCNVQPLHPGVGTPGGKESCLPADQWRQAAEGIHQPVCQHIRTRGGENF